MDNLAFENSYYEKIIKEVEKEDTSDICVASFVKK